MSNIGKRRIDLGDGEEEENSCRPRKRTIPDPQLVFAEALKAELHKMARELREDVRELGQDLITSIDRRVSTEALKLERLLHSVVREVKEEVQELKTLILRLISENTLHEARSPPPMTPSRVDERYLQLQFTTVMPQRVYEGTDIEVINLRLVDAMTGEVVSSGPESSMEFKIIVLDGQQGGDGTGENDPHELKPRKGKGQLLIGHLQVKLNKGEATVGKIQFTDNSSWATNKKFRLGTRVVSGRIEGIHVEEGKTEEFAVRSLRLKSSEKKYPPTSHDKVWRLKGISKDGRKHTRLKTNEIKTVEDLLRLLFMDSERLREILGERVNDAEWKEIIDHALTCIPNGRRYLYYTNEARNFGLIFNNFYGLVGIVDDNGIHRVETLPHECKVFLEPTIKTARENSIHFIEYDSEVHICCAVTQKENRQLVHMTNLREPADAMQDENVGDADDHREEPMSLDYNNICNSEAGSAPLASSDHYASPAALPAEHPHSVTLGDCFAYSAVIGGDPLSAGIGGNWQQSFSTLNQQLYGTLSHDNACIELPDCVSLAGALPGDFLRSNSDNGSFSSLLRLWSNKRRDEEYDWNDIATFMGNTEAGPIQYPMRLKKPLDHWRGLKMVSFLMVSFRQARLRERG